MVLGTEKRPRRSWVVWNENYQYPNIIVELLSDSTAKTDRGFKKTLYANVFQMPNYFWFDPESLEFAGFCFVNGTYEPIAPNAANHLWSEELGLFLGIDDRRLRFFFPDGTIVPSPEEAADAERERADRLAEKLRALGIEPD